MQKDREADDVKTAIEIDDGLMAQAMQASGMKTKRETVDAALRLFVQVKAQARARCLRGKIDWLGDLGAMRS